ncbi:MAG: G8 domain-containing protein [Chloroflexota bacterium]
MNTKFVRATIFVTIFVLMTIPLAGSSSGNINNRFITGIPVIDNYICGFGIFAQSNDVPINLGAVTHTAVQSGNWSDTATWGGSLPNEGAIVSIPQGIVVMVDAVFTTKVKLITIDGELQFANTVNTELWVDTLVSNATGRLEIGTAASPITASVTAKVVFADFGAIDRTVDTAQLSRGAVLHGQTEMYGTEKTSWTTLATQPAAGATQLLLSTTPIGWQVGDELVVAATDPKDPTSDEVVRIAAINGTTVTLDAALQKDHIAFAADLDVHVANISRNIEFSSENAAIAHRGHIMFMHTHDVSINYARFYQLGRTNKRIPLDDFTWPQLDDAPPMALEGDNIRGRYSIHFHRGGTDANATPAKVLGSVVVDDPGWAYVNHSGNVDFISNVSYNVVGGAFQTEAGDEIGSFINNIALRTVNPDYPLVSGAELVVDIREDRQDFAFQGDGFWLHGGGPRIEGNVVSGASGHAYIYWPEGLIEADRGATRVHPSALPNGHLLDSSIQAVDVWWMPVSSFKNNTGYASTKGLVFYYLHASFLGGNITEAYFDQIHSTFENTTLWGMRRVAMDFNFAENMTFINTRIVGNGDPNSLAVDANHFHNMDDYRFENLTIEGFGVGMDVPSQGNIVIEGGTFSNLVDFRIRNPQKASRTLAFNNITFGTSSAFSGSPRTNFQMDPDFTFMGEVQDDVGNDDGDKDPLFFLQPDRITLNFAPYNGQGLFYDEQRPDFIPMTAENVTSAEGAEPVPSQYLDKTNQQLLTAYGLSFGGALLPGDATAVTGIVGGQVGTAASAPTTFPEEAGESGEGEDTEEGDEGDDAEESDEGDDTEQGADEGDDAEEGAENDDAEEGAEGNDSEEDVEDTSPNDGADNASGTNQFPANAKILLLGDSRVEGERPFFESYRYELWKNLIDNGWTFDFVGMNTDETSYATYQGQSFDGDHQGGGGATTDDLLVDIDDVLASVGTPNIALIGIGGNDLLNGAQSTEAIASVVSNISQLIGRLQTSNANITIFIEQIAPGRSDFMSAELQAAFDEFNMGIATLASQQRSNTPSVIVVDIATGWSDSYMADEVHYNEAGAKAVADRYDAAMDAFYSGTGQPGDGNSGDGSSDDSNSDDASSDDASESNPESDDANDTDEGEDTDTGTDEGEDIDAGTDEGEDTDTGADESEGADAGTDEGEDSDAGTDEDEETNTGADEGEDSETGADEGEDSDTGADEGEDSDTGADTEEGNDEGADESPSYVDTNGNWFWFHIVAQTLNIEANTMWATVVEGQSLAELAEEEGSNAQALIDAIVAAETGMVESAVAAGMLTQETADEWLEGLNAAATEMVNARFSVSNESEATDETGEAVVPDTAASRRPFNINQVSTVSPDASPETTPVEAPAVDTPGANEPGDGNGSTTHTVFLPVVTR